MERADDRKDWMSLLAKAPAELLRALWDEAALAPEFTWLRRPEIAGVMVRGRAGGTGAAFNLGEMTVTRCALRLGSGEIGHAYVQGRDTVKAERAALCDALMQTGAAGTVRARILEPLAGAMAEARDTRARKAAATKVEFFTLVRGED